jgi:hypothetical protein
MKRIIKTEAFLKIREENSGFRLNMKVVSMNKKNINRTKRKSRISTYLQEAKKVYSLSLRKIAKKLEFFQEAI